MSFSIHAVSFAKKDACNRLIFMHHCIISHVVEDSSIAVGPITQAFGDL